MVSAMQDEQVPDGSKRSATLPKLETIVSPEGYPKLENGPSSPAKVSLRKLNFSCHVVLEAGAMVDAQKAAESLASQLGHSVSNVRGSWRSPAADAPEAQRQ